MDDGGLFDIEIGPGDYAEAAAGDAPTVSRTHQTETDFCAQKASYKAKVESDEDGPYEELIRALPLLQDEARTKDNGATDKTLLSKRAVQLLGYAVGELYYLGRCSEIIDMCQKLRIRYSVDGKTNASIDKWIMKSRQKVASKQR